MKSARIAGVIITSLVLGAIFIWLPISVLAAGPPPPPPAPFNLSMLSAMPPADRFPTPTPEPPLFDELMESLSGDIILEEPSQPPAPILHIQKKWEQWVVQNVSYNVSYTVCNIGGVNASPGHDTALYVNGSLIDTQEVYVELGYYDCNTSTFNTTVNYSGGYDEIAVCPDHNDEVAELVESGFPNCETNHWPPLPNLDIDVVSPVWVVANISYTVNYTVENRDANAPPGHYSGLYIDDVLVETQRVPVKLAPSATYNSSFNTTINLSGGYDSIRVCADYNNTVLEDNDNNCKTIYWPPLPDLTITDKWEVWVVENTSYTVNYTLCNHGELNASPGHYTGLYIDGNLKGTQRIPVKLAQYECLNLSFNTTVTLSNYLDTVQVCADYNGTVVEEYEYNCKGNYWPPLPDLQVTEKWEEWVVVNTSYTVNYTICNYGDVNASPGHYAALFIDDWLFYELQAVPIRLAPAECYHGRFNTTVNLSGGTDDIYVEADYLGDINEKSENNRVFNYWPPQPILAIVDKWEEWVVEGSSYNVSYKIANIGSGIAPPGHDVALYIGGGWEEMQEVPVALAESEIYESTFNTTIYLSGGRDRIRVYDDIYDEVREHREDSPGPKVNYWPPLPDLTASKHEEWVDEGTNYTVHFSIMNYGWGDAAAGHDVALYIDDVLIETKQVPQELGRYEGYESSFNTTINVSGDYDSIRVCADYYREVLESNEENNCRSNYWTALADLIPTDKWEEWVVENISYTVSYTICNWGDVTIPAGHDTGLIIDSNWSTIRTQEVTMDLAPDDCYTSTFNFTVNLSDGLDLIYLRPDWNFEVEKLYVQSLTIYWPSLPDLSIYKSEEWVEEGTNYTVHFRISNYGDSIVPAGHDTALFVDGALVEVQEMPYLLAPLYSLQLNFSTIVEFNGSQDNISVCADYYDEVFEAVEAYGCHNNTLQYIPPPEPPGNGGGGGDGGTGRGGGGGGGGGASVPEPESTPTTTSEPTLAPTSTPEPQITPTPTSTAVAGPEAGGFSSDEWIATGAGAVIFLSLAGIVLLLLRWRKPGDSPT